MMTFPIYGKIKHVPNHQLVITYHGNIIRYHCGVSKPLVPTLMEEILHRLGWLKHVETLYWDV